MVSASQIPARPQWLATEIGDRMLVKHTIFRVTCHSDHFQPLDDVVALILPP